MINVNIALYGYPSLLDSFNLWTVQKKEQIVKMSRTWDMRSKKQARPI